MNLLDWNKDGNYIGVVKQMNEEDTANVDSFRWHSLLSGPIGYFQECWSRLSGR